MQFRGLFIQFLISVFCSICVKVEELLSEIKATEEDVARWRKACELEVEAGKFEIEERDKVVNISLYSICTFNNYGCFSNQSILSCSSCLSVGFLLLSIFKIFYVH